MPFSKVYYNEMESQYSGMLNTERSKSEKHRFLNATKFGIQTQMCAIKPKATNQTPQTKLA